MELVRSPNYTNSKKEKWKIGEYHFKNVRDAVSMHSNYLKQMMNITKLSNGMMPIFETSTWASCKWK